MRLLKICRATKTKLNAMIKCCLLLIALMFTCCDLTLTDSQYSYLIEDASREKDFLLKPGRRFRYQQMYISLNTLDDTCMIGIMKVPPLETGLLYRIEVFADSIQYQYKPYKARKGKLLIEHSFADSF
jgi:hypothetical protein